MSPSLSKNSTPALSNAERIAARVDVLACRFASMRMIVAGETFAALARSRTPSLSAARAIRNCTPASILNTKNLPSANGLITMLSNDYQTGKMVEVSDTHGLSYKGNFGRPIATVPNLMALLFGYLTYMSFCGL